MPLLICSTCNNTLQHRSPMTNLADFSSRLCNLWPKVLENLDTSIWKKLSMLAWRHTLTVCSKFKTYQSFWTPGSQSTEVTKWKRATNFHSHSKTSKLKRAPSSNSFNKINSTQRSCFYSWRHARKSSLFSNKNWKQWSQTLTIRKNYRITKVSSKKTTWDKLSGTTKYFSFN